jgi:Spy/CpxP family protein refolding chaperone
MMKKNLAIILLVLLTLINIAALVTFAYHRFFPRMPFPPRGRTEPPDRFMQKELSLNEQQIKEFDSHFGRFRTETKPVVDSLRETRMKLNQEIAAERPDTVRLTQLADEIGRLEISLQKRMIRHMLETKDFLTPEQQKKFFSLFREGQRQPGDPMERGGLEGGRGDPDYKDDR